MNRKSPLEWKRYFESSVFDQEFYYDGDDLGCTLGENKTTFRVWAPTALQVTLNLYKSGDSSNEDLTESISMQKGERGVWSAVYPADLKNTYYTYTIFANGETHVTQDVYSRACGVNGQRSMAVDLSETDPCGWQNDGFNWDPSVLPAIYELHVKDFSFAESSGIPKEYRGRYKAFTITDSTLHGKGEKPTCLSYLKQLGITHVHLLPCYDFGSVDEAGDFDAQFNWGYDPVNYNVPEGSYATDPCDGAVRIREFKEMVQSLHAAGLGVIMDVVYNHTYSMDSCFQKTVPYYYYRVNEKGELSNGSICGNDTASERAMFRKYMADSVCYWAQEYHIDGFRFDLMGLHDVETMNEIRRRLNELPGGEHILMYGEPWAGDETGMKAGTIPALKKNLALLDPGIAIFNDDTRDAIKGSVFYEERPGYVNGKKGLEDEIRSSVLAWCDGKGGYQPHDPGQTITYISAHDNWTLWDKLNYTLLETPDFASVNERVKQVNRFAAGICMTSLGSIFFQAGEEAARTKLGIGDSYSSPPLLNALDWERMYQFEDLIEYYRGMLALRRSFHVYQMRSMDSLKAIRFYETEPECVIFSVDSDDAADPWKRLWVVYAAEKGKGCNADGADTEMGCDTERGYTDTASKNGLCEKEHVFDRITRTLELPCAERFLLSDGEKVLSGPVRVPDNSKITVTAGSVTVYGEA